MGGDFPEWERKGHAIVGITTPTHTHEKDPGPTARDIGGEGVTDNG